MKYVWILFFILITIRTIIKANKSKEDASVEPDFLDCLCFIIWIILISATLFYLTIFFW